MFIQVIAINGNKNESKAKINQFETKCTIFNLINKNLFDVSLISILEYIKSEI